MWIFSSPKDYSEMSEKISKSTFAILSIMLYILSCANNEFSDFLKQISFSTEYEIAGIKLTLALFYLPLIMAILEHMFKIHDKISDLLCIRKRYDRNVIIAEILKHSNIEIKVDKINDSQAKKIMSLAFYDYTSSTNPEIDSHYIHLTLNEWCWFWITLDTTFLLSLVGVVFLFLKWSIMNLIFVLLLISLLLLLLWLLNMQAKKYTKDEVAQIFNNKERKAKIVEGLKDALSSR